MLGVGVRVLGVGGRVGCRVGCWGSGYLAEGVVVDVVVLHVVRARALRLHLQVLHHRVPDAHVARGEVVAPHLEHLVSVRVRVRVRVRLP